MKLVICNEVWSYHASLLWEHAHLFNAVRRTNCIEWTRVETYVGDPHTFDPLRIRIDLGSGRTKWHWKVILKWRAVYLVPARKKWISPFGGGGAVKKLCFSTLSVPNGLRTSREAAENLIDARLHSGTGSEKPPHWQPFEKPLARPEGLRRFSIDSW